MKQSLFPAIAMIICSIDSSAQKIDAAKVPTNVTSSFATQFPGVAPKWEKEKGHYEASFRQGGKSMSATFEAAGKLLETEIDMELAQLPAAVTTYVHDHYKGKKIKEGAKITKADGSVNYEAEVEGKDLIFDAAGKFLREDKE